MKVAVLFSGGKDSTFAVDYCLEKGWDIEYLLSVKPTRTDCYIFHYATVEHTPLLAKQLNIPHKMITCDVANAKEEAELVRGEVLKRPKVDAVVLGGTGLQGQQIRSVQEALRPHGIDVFASHSGLDHDDVMRHMLAKGYKFMITQIAADGLTADDLDKVLDKNAMSELFERSKKFGFHCGGEGGHFDTFTVAGPIFKYELVPEKVSKVMEQECAGHLVVENFKTVEVEILNH